MLDVPAITVEGMIGLGNRSNLAEEASFSMLSKRRRLQGRAARLAAGSNSTIQAKIGFLINYDAGTVLAGQSFLLQLDTNANTKVVFHSSCGEGLRYRTRVFYVENGNVFVVQDSQNVLGTYDVDSFLSEKGGAYYIQMDILSGSAKMNFMATELSRYSEIEPVDNLYAALRCPSSPTIEAKDFFDNRMDHDFYILDANISEGDAKKSFYIGFAYDPFVLMDPKRYQPEVGYAVFQWKDSSVTMIEAGSFAGTTIDRVFEVKESGKWMVLSNLLFLCLQKAEQVTKALFTKERICIGTPFVSLMIRGSYPQNSIACLEFIMRNSIMEP